MAREKEQDQNLPARREERMPAPFEEFLESPINLMRRMREDMERIFQSLGIGSMMAPFERGMMMPQMRSWTPACDLWETDNDVKVRCDLPGVDPQNIEILTTEDTLHIRAEMRQETEDEEKKGVHRTERRFGRFERQFALPATVQSEKAKASFRHGTVEITLPKTEESKQKMKRVPIESSEEEISGTKGGTRQKNS